MKLKQIDISELKEHPKNRDYFKDIADASEEMWEAFKDNINELDLIEPLLVNEITMEVISGNQRFKACKELGRATVPCLLIRPEDGKELRMMISSNVMRRELDPFTLFEYIAMMRRGSTGIGPNSPSEGEFPSLAPAENPGANCWILSNSS